MGTEQRAKAADPQRSEIRKAKIKAAAPSLSRELVTRIWKKRVLWLIWMDSEAITNLHFQELDSNYWYHGLDLRELRAVYAILCHDSFTSDGDPLKREWRLGLRSKIEELDRKEQRGALTLTEWMHPAYLASDFRILYTFYRRNHPQFATGSRIYSVCQSF